MVHPQVREYLNTLERPIIFDIGAAGGTESFGLKANFPKSIVYAFEPDPRNIKDWRSNAVLAQYRHVSKEESIAMLKDVHLFECAVGSAVGTIEFHMSDGRPSETWTHPWQTGWQYSSSIKKPNKHLIRNPWCKFDKTINVPITTVDEFSLRHSLSKIDFIWMDVQGAENEVLKGANRMLDKISYIYAECMDKQDYEGEWSFDEMMEFFNLKGWSLVERYQEDVLFVNSNLF